MYNCTLYNQNFFLRILSVTETYQLVKRTRQQIQEKLHSTFLFSIFVAYFADKRKPCENLIQTSKIVPHKSEQEERFVCDMAPQPMITPWLQYKPSGAWRCSTVLEPGSISSQRTGGLVPGTHCSRLVRGSESVGGGDLEKNIPRTYVRPPQNDWIYAAPEAVMQSKNLSTLDF